MSKFLRVTIAAALLAGASASSPAAEPSVKTVVVRIHHSRFAPDGMSYRVGDRVRFVIRNTDPIDHEFILGDREVQERHENGTEAKHGAVPGEVSIPASTSAVTTYVFTKPGPLVFACHLPGHFAYGMKGTVQVSG